MENSKLSGNRHLVFLDASVLIAASHSFSGGSSLVLEICRGSHFQAAITLSIFIEARTNIAEKLPEKDLIRFYRQLALLDPEIIPSAEERELDDCAGITAKKDAHVLACALKCKAEYLISLDKKHLVTKTIRDSMTFLKVVTPGEFINEVLRREAK